MHSVYDKCRKVRLDRMIIKNAAIYLEDGSFRKGEIKILADRIDEVTHSLSHNHTSAEEAHDFVIDADGLYAVPGLTDIHFHGCAGYDFCDGTKEALDAITLYEAEQGVTTICPATMSLPEDILTGICNNAAGYNSSKGSILTGIHVEGPYLSVKKKGAQNEAFIRKPDINMFHRLNEASGNLFKIVTVAPEEEGAMEFIRELKDQVVISLGHTTADYDIAYRAYQSGASHTTHLYNAMPPFLHRDPGVIGAAFDSPQASVEIICDGIHLHPGVVRATLAMFGEDRVIFISDSMMATGLKDGMYSLGGQEVQVKGKKATLADGTIAGSATNLMDCVRNAVKTMGIPLETAIKASAVNPAKKIGIYDEYGSITAGKIANLVLLDKELNIRYVIIRGSIL